MAGARAADGVRIVTWQIHIAATPSPSDAARITELVAGQAAGHLYQYPLLDRIEDGPRVRMLCAWAERSGVIGATAVARLRRMRGVGPWIARIDRGPVVAHLDALAPLLDAFSEHLRKEGVAAVRLNPLLRKDEDGGVPDVLREAGFSAVEDDDYNVTLEVPIDFDRDGLLASFPKGTRYSIRQGSKAGVVTDRNVGEPEIAALEALYAAMVTRKGATPRPPGFFQAIAGFLAADPSRGFIQVSRLAGEVVGSIIVTRYGPRALYTFGASKEADDGVPKMYLVQYEAMVEARSLGCTVYDLGGFSAGVGEEGARTPAQSINFFKTRFSKNAVAFVPCHERVLRPVLHRIVEGAKRLAKTAS